MWFNTAEDDVWENHAQSDHVGSREKITCVWYEWVFYAVNVSEDERQNGREE